MLLICLRVDETGARPVMLDDRDELACTEDVEWRFVASVRDRDEGQRLLKQLHFEHGERSQDTAGCGSRRATARTRLTAAHDSPHITSL